LGGKGSSPGEKGGGKKEGMRKAMWRGFHVLYPNKFVWRDGRESRGEKDWGRNEK